MHLEPPKAPLVTLREFGLHYLMIVVSILTAIGLEELLRFHDDAKAAREAQASIEREILANLDDLRAAMKTDREHLDAIRKLGDTLAEDIRTIKDSAALQKKVGEDFTAQFRVGVMFPTLQQEAWDVAVASQAAVHIPREKLEAYSAAYALERDVIQSNGRGATIMDGARLFDMRADMEIGIVDPKRTLEMVREVQAATGNAESNLSFVEHQIDAALDKGRVPSK